MNKKVLLVVIILILTATYLTVQAFFDADGLRKEVVKNVKIQISESGDVLNSRKFSGVVEPEKESRISSKISGYVVEMKKREGEYVRKGEVLAVVDGDDLLVNQSVVEDNLDSLRKISKETKDYYEQLVNETEVGVSKARKEYLSVKNNDSSSGDEISVAKKGYVQAKESLESAKKARDLQLQLVEAKITQAIGQSRISKSYSDDRNITAPYSGVITRKVASVGEGVSLNSVLYEIADLDEKVVEIFVPPVLIEKLNVGQSIELTLENGNKSQGSVLSFSPLADRTSRKALVTIAVDGDLMLGEFVTLDLSVELSADATIIKKEAVVSEYYDEFVFVNDSGVARKKRVELGNESGDFVEVVSGVESGEEIVVEGQFYLKEGDRISIL